MPKRTQLTEAEREQRRAADRAFVQQAVEQLRSSDGWQRWLATRRHFHATRCGTSSCSRCRSWLHTASLSGTVAHQVQRPRQLARQRHAAIDTTSAAFVRICLGPNVTAPPRHLTA